MKKSFVDWNLWKTKSFNVSENANEALVTLLIPTFALWNDRSFLHYFYNDLR